MLPKAAAAQKEFIKSNGPKFYARERKVFGTTFVSK
jgi:hypothetical protein